MPLILDPLTKGEFSLLPSSTSQAGTTSPTPGECTTVCARARPGTIPRAQSDTAYPGNRRAALRAGGGLQRGAASAGEGGRERRCRPAPRPAPGAATPRGAHVPSLPSAAQWTLPSARTSDAAAAPPACSSPEPLARSPNTAPLGATPAQPQ
jgi:hypothetical protein